MRQFKITTFVVAITALLSSLSSCARYDDYVDNLYTEYGVYFPHSKLSRSVIAGEGLNFSIGVALGGVLENTEKQTVKFEIDETLLEGTDYTLLPEEYYTLVDGDEITVEKGKLLGLASVEFSEDIYNDDLMVDAEKYNYALPLTLVETSFGEIKSSMKSCIYAVKMINTYEGYYKQVGQETRFTEQANGTLVYDSASVYGDALDATVTPVKEFVSSSANSVVYTGVGTFVDATYAITLTFDADNNVTFSTADDSVITEVEGEPSTWNPVNRTLDLSYTYHIGNKMYVVEEELTFRNRIRDGLSEWNWPGFDGN